MRGRFLISAKQARLMSGSGLVPFLPTPSPTTHSHYQINYMDKACGPCLHVSVRQETPLSFPDNDDKH